MRERVHAAPLQDCDGNLRKVQRIADTGILLAYNADWRKTLEWRAPWVRRVTLVRCGRDRLGEQLDELMAGLFEQ